MFRNLAISILFLAFAMVQYCNAQQNSNSDNYSVVNWNTDQGFPSKYTNCFLKDVNSFLWIGTRTGLSRFDGSIFKNYFPGAGKTKSIPGANVIGLKEDSLHNIWIGTDNGMARYDIKADTFTVFYPALNKNNFYTSIIPFWCTQNEVLCIEADSIFTAYNIHSLKKRVIVRLPQKIGNDRIVPLSVFDIKTNSVWMPPASGYLSAASGLFNVSLSTGKAALYDWSNYKEIPHHSTWTEGMCYDNKRNCLWLNNDDLIQFTLSDRKFHYIDAVKNIHDRGVGICSDMENRIWVGTGDKGIFIYNPGTNTVEVPFSKDSILRGNVNWANNRIYCDRDGFVWVGYWTQFGKGIMQLIPGSETARHYDILGGGSTMLKTKTSDGELCVLPRSEDTLLSLFNPKTCTEDLIIKSELKGVDKNKKVGIVGVDSSLKKAWLYTAYPFELYQMDMTSFSCYPVTIKDLSNKKITLDNIEDMEERLYKYSYVFIGLWQNNEGVFILNKDSAVANQIIGLGNDAISDIATDGNSMLFLRIEGATINLSYTLTKNKWVQTHTPVDSIPWIGVYRNNADDTWWVSGAYMQLLHYDKNFHLLHRYTQNDGIHDVQIHSIITDNAGDIWFNGSSGYISKLSIKTGTITSLSAKDGYRKQPNYPAYNCSKDNDGNLYFAGYEGIDRIKPDKYISSPATVYVKSLSIKQFVLPSSTGFNNINELSLKYFQNRINIETGTIDFYSAGKNYIRYKLEGRDESWQYAPANYIIQYEELPPNRYVLQLQAGNEGNEFTGPVKKLFININPPFWQTWWFRILAVVIAIVVVYVFIQYRLRNLKRRNVMLEDKVLNRTKELKHSLEELRSTQAQLIQSEKMASLGELTSGIAHEIKNPLNFIKNFSEINIELITEVEEEQLPNLDENTQTEMTSVLKTLKKNAEKINHHGNRIDGIVSGMLQHSRLGNIQKELTDINALCDESLKLAYNGFRSKEKAFSATFETHFEPGLPKLMIVPQDIGRVLINLINNAFYTVNEKKKNSQPISLADNFQTPSLYKPCVVVNTKKSDSKIYITVTDNGMGISPQIINKIYQPFFTTKPTGEGTGLGLSMSYDIITKGHNGELNVKSEEGKGTDFEIVLPAS